MLSKILVTHIKGAIHGAVKIFMMFIDEEYNQFFSIVLITQVVTKSYY